MLPTQAPCFPAITGLQDLASGAALAAMLHYYCPQLVRLEGELEGHLGASRTMVGEVQGQGGGTAWHGGHCRVGWEGSMGCRGIGTAGRLWGVPWGSWALGGDWVPEVEDVVGAVCDPLPPPFPDVCLKEPMSVADSLYNLQLLQDFCARRLGGGCPLALEDLLYMPPALRVSRGARLPLVKSRGGAVHLGSAMKG